MGTRHLVCVAKDDELKVANYGQWDGYPEGQGRGVCDFIQQADMEKFCEKIDSLSPITDEDIEEVNSDPNWSRNYPWYSRDAGSEILWFIFTGKCTKVNNDPMFAADSLMCEWCYVLDLDREVLEVYRGFIEHPHNEGRFADMELREYHTRQYYPVKLEHEIDFLDIELNGPEALLKLYREEEECT